MAENPRIEELRRRVQADPASIAFAALAEEFRRVGRYDDAIDTCRQGLARHPAYLSARVTLGRALIEMGEYDAAREELETVLRSAPENIAATRGLAQIHELLGHSTEMAADLVALAGQVPIRVAPPPPAPEPEPVPVFAPEPMAPPLSLSSFDLPLAIADPDAPGAEDAASEPVDIFTAALLRAAAPEPVSEPEFRPELALDPPPAIAFESPQISFEPPPAVAFEAPPVAFEPATIAFEAPVLPAGMPDPHVAATLLRLERFLGAIQTARRA